jgi:hypothetical protein
VTEEEERMRLSYVLCSIVVLLAAVPARADGPAGLRPIAAGVSAGGQHWAQSARADRGRITYEVALPVDGESAGGIMDGPLRRTSPLHVGRGDGFGRDRTESELDGVVHRSVVRVRVTTTRRVLSLRLRRAPAAAVRRWPGLREARFFIQFFGADERPTKIEALDSHGVVASERGV